MDGDERDIFQFLKSWGTTYVGATEIARRAGNRKRFHEDPEWAKPILVRMADRGILESDAGGRYRIKPVSRKDRQQRWVSPDIAKILKEGGVEVGDGNEVGSDDYYEDL